MCSYMGAISIKMRVNEQRHFVDLEGTSKSMLGNTVEIKYNLLDANN